MNNFTIGDVLKVKEGFPHAGTSGELKSVNIETGDWILSVPDAGDIEVNPDGLELAEDEQPTVVPLDIAKETLANTFFRLGEAKNKHLQASRQMIEAIRNNPELAALQEEIELWDAQVNQLESDYNLAIEQAREAAIAEHLAGQPKKRYDGLIQVKKLTSVLHWDAKKALVWAQSLDNPEYRAVLIKQSADKTGFKKLADVIDMPDEVIQIGDSYTAAITEKHLMEHVTIRSVADSQHKNVLESVETDEQVVDDWSDVPF